MAVPKPNVPKVPPKPWVPAGYLPAPKQARFISEAEQAAQKLPPTTKPQSLKNALLKGGAKPLELEYAGIDDFISQNQGKPVSAADVLAHLKTEGPLGKLKRVEQQVVDGQAFGGIHDEDPYSNPNYDESVQLLAPEYASDVRKPFDQQAASNQTGYHGYTVPGKRNDFTGYREILLEDPRNALHDQDRMVMPENGPDPINAHDSDYFARFNEYPDRIALQNIQSDMGQDYTKNGKIPELDEAGFLTAKERARELDQKSQRSGLNNEEMQELRSLDNAIADYDGLREMDADLDILNQRLDDLNQRWSRATDAEDRYDIAEEIKELQEQGAQDYLLNYTPEGDAYFESKGVTPLSPFARDDNWKNLMARHIALQSINGGGKPITIPTGRQMVDTEGFGLSTHKSNREAAAKAADAYNADLVRRLQKIFRGLHPDGASATSHALDNARESMGPIVSGRLKSQEIDDIWYSMIPDFEGMDQHFIDKSELKKIGEETGRRFDPYEEIRSGLSESSNADQMIYRLATDRDRFLEPDAVWELEDLISQGPSPEMMQAAMKQIQARRLLNERGPPPATMGHSRHLVDASKAPSPGWTIKPSPMAVRQGLEKGLPIMSLAPLLLQPQGERK